MPVGYSDGKQTQRILMSFVHTLNGIGFSQWPIVSQLQDECHQPAKTRDSLLHSLAQRWPSINTGNMGETSPSPLA